ncbi:hypothetical protein BB560_001636 [Smittium megazygosporum]|uniref:Enoyl-CoA hydratase n=1 Tax=Smittium megazygosporum TaxID=133381 RepID=A0A2T9ZH17_9FUNG|nr:hypothetical protein BB560_001636 [Smittium megazygosporum]
MTEVKNMKFETLTVELSSTGVLLVKFNRPDRLNAVNPQMWEDLKSCFTAIRTDGNVRSVVLAANGKVFCSGLDLKETKIISPGAYGDVARKGYYQRLAIIDLQDSISAIENCDKPVICAVQNACIGAGIDIITASDVRYCSEDAFFMVKEVDIGMAADVGTLQRLPKVVSNDSWVREICYTTRRIDSKEASEQGLISKVFPNSDTVLAEAIKTANIIASKSPVAIVSTKHLLNFSRDHTVEEGLKYTALWNALAHNTGDMKTAISSFFQKTQPKFSKL